MLNTLANVFSGEPSTSLLGLFHQVHYKISYSDLIQMYLGLILLKRPKVIQLLSNDIKRLLILLRYHLIRISPLLQLLLLCLQFLKLILQKADLYIYLLVNLGGRV
jgi:hypothetical protein